MLYTPVTLDSAGNVYGTTYGGGQSCPVDPVYGCGVVFKVDTDGNETVLHAFTGGADGAYPSGGLVLDSAGNLYGTAAEGGFFNSDPCASGCGVVFKLDAAGQETVLYSFTGGADGSFPSGGLVRDSEGDLYGVVSDLLPAGAVFKLDTAGALTVLYAFTGGADGGGPSGLVLDRSGNLYGTATSGGGGVCSGGCGVVFKLDTAGNETVLYTFAGFPDGAHPETGVVRNSAGDLYGTTFSGGNAAGDGVVFKLKP
ncbi:MAG: choice-of-anchor tandem repeat GloVer-containing protein [Bryobacteraceae bacterium]